MAILAAVVGLLIAGAGLWKEDDLFKYTGLGIAAAAVGVGSISRPRK